MDDGPRVAQSRDAGEINGNFSLDLKNTKVQGHYYNNFFSSHREVSEYLMIHRKDLKEKTGVTAMNVAKRLLDKGYHAPTTYFPLLVPECLLIEPAETESKETLDAFVVSMKEILVEAHKQPEIVKGAPHTTSVRRLDEVKAARELDLAWKQ